MAHGDFVWCDLSSRRLDLARRFYGQLFGWHYDTLQAADGSDYVVASNAAGPTAGLYTMPETFQNMGMPCFWMSYTAVSSVEQAVADGSQLGGKVELGPLDWGDGSRVALIRDPLGAGFTVVEGGDFSVRSPAPQHAGMAWNALYVSDAQAIIGFYERLFDWQFKPQSTNPAQHDIANASGQHISTVHELPTALRGKEQYWAIDFAVDDLVAAEKSVLAAGGSFQDMGGCSAFVTDPDGAGLFVRSLS